MKIKNSINIILFLFALEITFICVTSCKKTTVTQVPFQTLELQPQDGNDVSVFYYIDSTGADSGGIADKNFYGDSILYINAFTSPHGSTGANSLIKFDGLSAIPSNATILVARLYLYGTDSSNIPVNFFGNQIVNGGNSYHAELSDSIAFALYNTHADTAYDNTILFQKITGAWDAHTVTYNTQPSVSTTDSSLISASSSQWNYNVTIDVTSFVKDWFANPSTNFGLKFSIANTNYFPALVYINHQMVFNSSSASNAVLRPELVVVYQ